MKSRLTFAAICFAAVLAVGGAARADITSNLIWHCPLQDNAANTTVAETVGHNNGTLTGAGNTSASSVAGPGGLYPLALNFDGVDDWVASSWDSGLTTNTVTYAAFVKRDGTQIDWAGLLVSRGAAACSIFIGPGGSQLRFMWDGTSDTYDWASGVTIPEGEWCLCAAAISPTSTTIYCRSADGKQVNSFSYSAEAMEAVHSPKIATDTGTRAFKGAIAGARIYNRTLTEADLDELWETVFESHPADYAGYDTITPVNPSSSLTGWFYVVNANALSASWWANVKPDGGDIRAHKEDGTRLPVYLHNWDYANQTGLILIGWSGVKSTSSESIRIYAGNASNSQPAANASYGQYEVFPATLRAFYPEGGGNDVTSYANHQTMYGSPTVGGVSGPIAGSKGTDYNGSTQYGSKSSASISSTYPATVLASINTDTVSGGHDFANLVGSGNGHYLGLNQSGTTLRAFSFNGAAGASTSTIASAAWTHAAARIVTNSSRTLVENGSPATTATENVVISSLDTILVGCRPGPSTYTDGKLSMVGFADSDLGNNWVAYWHAMLADSDQSDFYAFDGWTSESSFTPSLGGDYIDSVDGLLNPSPSGSNYKDVFTEFDPGGTSTWNPNLLGGGGPLLDLTGVAWVPDSHKPQMVAITKRHVLVTQHVAQWAEPGSELVFVRADGAAVIRTVIDHRERVGLNDAGNNGDMSGLKNFHVLYLDEDLPESIATYPIWADQSAETSNIPMLKLNQNRQLLVADRVTVGTRADVYLNEPSDETRQIYYATAISGDSGSPVFAVVGSQLVYAASLTTAGTPGGFGPNAAGRVAWIQEACRQLNVVNGGAYMPTLFRADATAARRAATQRSINH